MPSAPRVAAFVALVLACFAALLLLGPTGVYPDLYRAAANGLFDAIGADATARFEPFDDPHGMHDTRMSIGRRSVGFPKGIGINSIRQGYAPAALIVALALATPVAWRLRLRLLVAGLVVVHVFVAARVMVTALWGLSVVRVGGESLVALSPATAWLVRKADQVLSGDLHVTYLAPLMIWLALTASWCELVRLWNAPPDGARPLSSGPAAF